VIPHPVDPSLKWEASSPPKQNRLIAIGRWDDEIQKRPALLTEVTGRLLAENSELEADIVGNRTERIDAWHSTLPASIAARVKLHGKLPHQELAKLLHQARVFYCPSAYESFNIAAAEAMCCGCSVVAADLPAMASFRWFVSQNSGSLTAKDNADGHLDALRRELALWENSSRNPMVISHAWIDILHADKVALRIVKIIAEQKDPK
jgi:glycosyltransferase involved in cell wall biosynthesis